MPVSACGIISSPPRFRVRRFNEIGLTCHLPRGSFYAFPSVSGHGLGERDSRWSLLDQERVAMVPGTASARTAGVVRASFATSYEQIGRACTRTERFVQGLRRSA